MTSDVEQAAAAVLAPTLAPPAGRLRTTFRVVLATATLRDILGWSVGAALVVAYAAMLRRYSVNFPALDDYAAILILPLQWATATTLWEKLAGVFAFANEHRIVTLRLAVMLDTQSVRGLDFRLLMTCRDLVDLLDRRRVMQPLDYGATGFPVST